MVPPDNQDNEGDLAEWNDFNNQVIAEFRSNGGHVGGFWEGVSLLLLHTVGAKSGVERVHPVTRSADGDRLFVVASRGGDDRNPDWFYNIVANPQVIVETGSETLPMRATVAEEPERSRLFKHRVAERAVFSEYEAQTSRVIPVVILSRESMSEG